MASPARSEADLVREWRCEQLRLLGFCERDVAELLDDRCDIHELADLIAAGCPLHLAKRIVL